MPEILPPRRPIVAIDGPAGAGKSTIAAHLAARFDLLNLETGAMFRAFALKALRGGLPLDNAAALNALTAETRIELAPGDDGRNVVLLDGADVSVEVRGAAVTAAASEVSVHPPVRQWMVAQWRRLGAGGGVVMEGRDIGTVVFPDAEVKIFLDADPDVRGSRRFLQVAAPRLPQARLTEAELVADMRERDARDRSRADSPLRPADDATVIDSTALTLGQVLARCEALVLGWNGTAADGQEG